MSITYFQKIATGIQFDWDVPAMLSKIPGTPNANSIWMKSAAGEVTDQIYFSEHFHITFPIEFSQACIVVRDLQSACANLNDPSDLIQDFLKYNPALSELPRINLVKTKPGVSVVPHVDGNRLIVLNLGLVNSNIGETQISGAATRFEFYQSPYESYIMEDGDAYLLRTGNVHAVRALTPLESGPDRYILSVCVKF